MMGKQSNVTAVTPKVVEKNNNDCRSSMSYQSTLDYQSTLLMNFHLLLFGVTKTIITKVGDVVAFSVSLVSAVRAKLDSCYLQRQFSLFNSSQQFNHQHHHSNLLQPAPITIIRRKQSYQYRDQ